MFKNSRFITLRDRLYRWYDIYGLYGLLKLVLNYIKTKSFSTDIRLIRFPIEIRGEKFIDWGRNLTIGKNCRIEAYPYYSRLKLIHFGSDVEINDCVHITAVYSVKIGNNVLIASKVYISDCTHGQYKGENSDSDPNTKVGKRKLSGSPVVIEDNVWIGEFVSILPGVTIGQCSIVGSNSVVTKNVDPYTIVVGSPARPIKKYSFETNRWIKIK